jgi:cytochrome c553
MTAKFLASALLLAALGCSAGAYAAGSVEAGQAKAATCAACHGVDGNSANPEWPSLAGQHVSYLTRQLQAFRSGERQNVLMSPMAMILSDEDVADLAAFFSAQSIRGGEAEPSKAALGLLR